MFTLKVIAGKHTHTDGKVYNAGEVFQSSTDLRKKFRNKFELVEPAQTAGPVPPKPAETVTERQQEEMREQAKAGVQTATTTTPQPPKPARPQRDAEEEDFGPTTGTTNPPGGSADNVTAEFPEAAEADVAVFVDSGGTYSVYDVEGDKALNATPLKTPSQVKQFIRAHIKKGGK